MEHDQAGLLAQVAVANRRERRIEGRDKVKENRVRRMASRQRLLLRKSERRDPWASDYGTYMLTDASRSVVAGDRDHGYGMTLDDVEAWLTSEHD